MAVELQGGLFQNYNWNGFAGEKGETILYPGVVRSFSPNGDSYRQDYAGETFTVTDDPLIIRYCLVGLVEVDGHSKNLYAVQAKGSEEILPAVQDSIWYGGDDYGDGGPCDKTTYLVDVGPFPEGLPKSSALTRRPDTMDDALREFAVINSRS